MMHPSSRRTSGRQKLLVCVNFVTSMVDVHMFSVYYSATVLVNFATSMVDV